jgi:hypothetical protein
MILELNIGSIVTGKKTGDRGGEEFEFYPMLARQLKFRTARLPP